MAVNIGGISPGLSAGIVLQSASAPMMAAPALAALLGLDATLVLIALVSSSPLVPLTAPFFAYLSLGDALSISSATLGWKLLGLLASSAIVGLGLRRHIGITSIERYRLEIDGGNIVGLFIFAAALMGNVASGLLADPLLWFGLLAARCLAFVIFSSLSVLVFWRTGCEAARAVGFMTAQRNVGLILAAAG